MFLWLRGQARSATWTPRWLAAKLEGLTYDTLPRIAPLQGLRYSFARKSRKDRSGTPLKTFKIAVIAGDGIGKEVVPEAIRVLDAAGLRFGFRFEKPRACASVSGSSGTRSTGAAKPT